MSSATANAAMRVIADVARNAEAIAASPRARVGECCYGSSRGMMVASRGGQKYLN
jgi:hypothetical protein